jgi:sialic acid synthase SpsE
VAKAGKTIFFVSARWTCPTCCGFADICREHGNTDLVPVHDFHTDLPGQMHMRTIPFLKRTLGCPVGFSAPGRNHDLDVMAVALGANMLEKRGTLDRATQAHHHVLCLEPRECRPDRALPLAGRAWAVGLTPSSERATPPAISAVCAPAPIRRGQPFSRDTRRQRPEPHSHFYLNIFSAAARRDIAQDTLLEWTTLRSPP